MHHQGNNINDLSQKDPKIHLSEELRAQIDNMQNKIWRGKVKINDNQIRKEKNKN